MVIAGTAAAQGTSTDPQPGSPAGAIYELPLDGARSDAAPRRPSGQGAKPRRAAGARPGGGAARPAAPSAPIRSENGFGSSSSVPGADGDARSGATGGGARSPGSAGGSDSSGSGESPGSSGSGFSGSAGAAPMSPSSEPRPASVRASVESEPSRLLSYGLLALVIAAALAGGLATRLRGGSAD